MGSGKAKLVVICTTDRLPVQEIVTTLNEGFVYAVYVMQPHWTDEWDGRLTSPRGWVQFESMARRNVDFANTGSIIDVTF